MLLRSNKDFKCINMTEGEKPRIADFWQQAKSFLFGNLDRIVILFSKYKEFCSSLNILNKFKYIMNKAIFIWVHLYLINQTVRGY